VTSGLRYDFLMDTVQNLRIHTAPHHTVMAGSRQSEAYAGYCLWLDGHPDKQQAVAYRDSLIGRYADTFLAAYLAALQPVQNENITASDDLSQILLRYRYQRQHFFDYMDLSDVRLLHTPLYHETIRYYFSGFVTQQPDTLIYLAYRLLEKASGNAETFFFVADFLTDYSLRSNIEHIDRLYRFLHPNRYMLSDKILQFLPAGKRTMHFMLHDTESVSNRFTDIPMYDASGQAFHATSLPSRYRIYYFWDATCPRCISDAASWQSLLNRRSGAYSGIAVNVRPDVPSRVPAPVFQCSSVTTHFRQYEHLFLSHGYAKTIVTDADGSIMGIFASLQALDAFLNLL
jgi:hypothetical protein